MEIIELFFTVKNIFVKTTSSSLPVDNFAELNKYILKNIH